MNNKAKYLYDILDIVVDCCATEIDSNGRMSVTKEDVLGKSRAENVSLTREIFAIQVVNAGYSVTTVAQLLKRTPQSVRHLIAQGYSHEQTSNAFRLAKAEATIKCRDIPSTGI